MRVFMISFHIFFYFRKKYIVNDVYGKGGIPLVSDQYYSIHSTKQWYLHAGTNNTGLKQELHKSRFWYKRHILQKAYFIASENIPLSAKLAK